jgi:hypothetical protein
VSSQAPATKNSGRRRGTWVEAVSAVVLARLPDEPLTSEQAKAGSQANAARLESTRWSNLANTQTEIDVATFTQRVDSYARNETALADFYRRRFRIDTLVAALAFVPSAGFGEQLAATL